MCSIYLGHARLIVCYCVVRAASSIDWGIRFHDDGFPSVVPSMLAWLVGQEEATCGTLAQPTQWHFAIVYRGLFLTICTHALPSGLCFHPSRAQRSPFWSVFFGTIGIIANTWSRHLIIQTNWQLPFWEATRKGQFICIWESCGAVSWAWSQINYGEVQLYLIPFTFYGTMTVNMRSNRWITRLHSFEVHIMMVKNK